ncbi:hypothetical protein AB0B54_24415 [Microbispora bryophytorum]|uniref:hypothetical protein n=1 Tax=Microbispora bryophytorum TaxID=1460882 RepID=UPI0033CB72BA
MGVDAVLMRVEQPGSSPKSRRLTPAAVALDHNDSFVRLVDQIRGRSVNPMLERIDPYGSVILTSAEMPQFIEELARLRAFAVTAEDVRVIREFEDLARECAANPALELHLDGD